MGPLDTEHAEKIYYITGFLLKTIDNLGKRAKGEVATVLDHIQSNAVATKEEATDAALAMGLTKEKEKGSLFYVNEAFYK